MLVKCWSNDARGDARAGTPSAGGAAHGGEARGGGARCEPAEEELEPRMATVYLPLYRDTQLGRVTHLCPRGPVANGLGSDWCEERGVG